MRPTDLIPLASRRGLVVFDRALGQGLSRAAWYRAIDAGRLLPVHAGVARLPGAPLDYLARVEAAVGATGPGSLASHLSAAQLWGATFDVDPEVVHVIVPRARRAPVLDGVVVHRPLDLLDLRPSTRAAIRTCNPLRAAVDLGAVATDDQVIAAIDTFLADRIVSFGALRAALDRHARRGHPGVAALRRVLAERTLQMKPTDSLLESQFGELVAAAGLPVPIFHPLIRLDGVPYEPDFAFPSEGVVVEVDGYGPHHTRAAFERDRERDAHLASHGWLTVRFTWTQVNRRAALVADRLRQVLTHRRTA